MINQGALTLYDYFGGCRNMRVITNSRGYYVQVPCGHCPDCRFRKGSRYIALCNQESAENKYTEFITLTYNYANLPIVKLIQSKIGDKTIIKYIDVTSRKVHADNKNCRTYRKSDTFGQEIHRIPCGFKNPIFKKFYKKSRFKSTIFKARKFNHLSVLSKDDLQKFFKRLRFHVAKDFDTEIRYFGVGEYTPTHFLPHYHVILYHNDARLHTLIEEYVVKSWKYGIASIEPAKSNNGVASYVSGYTNSFTKLPYFLNGAQIAPFSLHSHYLGTKTNYELASTIYQYERIPFEEINYTTSKSVRKFSLSSQVASYFFPKCYNFKQQTDENALKLYTIYHRQSKTYKTESVVDICKYILLNPYEKTNLSLLKSIDMTPINDFCPGVFLDVLETTDKLDEKGYISLFNRLYSVILISRHFYRLTQCSYFDNMPQYKRNLTLFNKIKDFYCQREYNSLTTQLQMQQEYFKEYSVSDYDLFFPIGNKKFSTYKDWEDYYKNKALIKYIAFENDIKYDKKIKHKELNDLNDIFVNPSF